MYCNVCGVVDDAYDDGTEAIHNVSTKHLCNLILYEYKEKKRLFTKNREQIFIFCDAKSVDAEGKVTTKQNIDHVKVRIYVKPMQKVKFVFKIKNETKKENLLVVGIHLGHPQPQFEMNDHPYRFESPPHVFEKQSRLPEEVSVEFKSSDIGQYEMPIMFTFHRESDKKDLIFIREMVVIVEESPLEDKFMSPYMNKSWDRADHFISSTSDQPIQKFKIPKLLKMLLPRGLEEQALEGFDKLPREIKEQLRILLIETRAIFDEGITKGNYMRYFHHLLWWEEIIAKINLKKYNMTEVSIVCKGNVYELEVPGLAEKRPSLMRSDRVFLRLHGTTNVIFEGVIKNIQDSCIHIGELDESFHANYNPDALFDVRFITCRVPFERSHEAVSRVFASKQDSRIFPEPRRHKAPVLTINKFYNKLIKNNEEQKSAVEHIVSGTSGKAPYIVFGPPGTGKTLTIVEAIVQLVRRNPRNRVLVCTDSNMAADHIALMLLKYNKVLNINNYLVRANAQTREWSVMPPELANVSNGTSFESFVPLSNDQVSMYRIMVTTLLHAAKYASERCQRQHKLQVSHLFIDEAAQAWEPAALVPVSGLLVPAGQLVLAGDPKQLGPVCISKSAGALGLGTSLMERLLLTHENLYEKNPDYMTLLVKNFRSDPEILKIPNELFYQNQLQALAEHDPLSRVSVLGLAGGQRAVVFHAVHSREQRMGKAPSYFNVKELEMLQRYIKSLMDVHNVLPEDIGVIAPYIRQVYKVKGWLAEQNYGKIEVGTVEAFQGKEKRVILVSTVRANCRLLEYDAKYGLGFLVDDKRYNVALTRAKAKIIIIGNPACLVRDVKWRAYMGLCEEFGTYHGKEHQQVERSAALLVDIARTRFDRCRITHAMKEIKEKK